MTNLIFTGISIFYMVAFVIVLYKQLDLRENYFSKKRYCSVLEKKNKELRELNKIIWAGHAKTHIINDDLKEEHAELLKEINVLKQSLSDVFEEKEDYKNSFEQSQDELATLQAKDTVFGSDNEKV